MTHLKQQMNLLYVNNSDSNPHPYFLDIFDQLWSKLVHPQNVTKQHLPRHRVAIAVGLGVPGPLGHFTTIGDHQGQSAGGVHAQVIHGLEIRGTKVGLAKKHDVSLSFNLTF